MALRVTLKSQHTASNRICLRRLHLNSRVKHRELSMLLVDNVFQRTPCDVGVGVALALPFLLPGFNRGVEKGRVRLFGCALSLLGRALRTTT